MYRVNYLKQGKGYLTQQLSELTKRANLTEERRKTLSQQLSTVKQAKEQLYEEFMKSK